MELLASGLHALLYSAAIGVMVLAVYGFPPVSCFEECTPSVATLRIQNSCKQEDNDLTSALANKDNLQICRNMAVMFKCAVTSVPGCYDYFEAAIFNMYFHSPYSCELSGQQIMELQSIHNKGTQADDELSTSSPADVGFSTVIPTEQYIEEDLVHTSHNAASADTYQHVTATPINRSQTANIPCGYGCMQEEEQRGSLENNGARWVVSSRIPVVALVVLSSRSLSWILVS